MINQLLGPQQHATWVTAPHNYSGNYLSETENYLISVLGLKTVRIDQLCHHSAPITQPRGCCDLVS